MTSTISPALARPKAGSQRHRRALTYTASFLLLSFGATLLLMMMFAPAAVERTYGDVKTTLAQLGTDIVGAPPEVNLGASGGEELLDRCDGTFSEMVRYQEEPDVPPTWAAHNNCGGDVILPFEIGTEVSVDGESFTVVDIRMLPKLEATSEDLIGLQGEIALQTCLYGQLQMKLVGLNRTG